MPGAEFALHHFLVCVFLTWTVVNGTSEWNVHSGLLINDVVSYLSGKHCLTREKFKINAHDKILVTA